MLKKMELLTLFMKVNFNSVNKYTSRLITNCLSFC